MTKEQNSKQYDLEERTLEFSRATVKFYKGLSKTVINEEVGKQLIRAATSVGANYEDIRFNFNEKPIVLDLAL